MPTTTEQKFSLVFEAKEKASKKIARLRKELVALGGPQMVKSQSEIKKLTRQISQLSGTTSKSTKIFSRFTNGIAIGNLAASGLEKVLSGLSDGFKYLITEIGKATMIAAGTEELGALLNFVGQKAGYSTEQIDSYVVSLENSGIAQRAARRALLRAAQAEISFTDAVKLGKIAQDAATIGTTDSSEAFQVLLNSTAKLMPRQLKELGIILNLNQVYKEYAQKLGITATSMTETQKKQAMLNAIFKKGELIAGAYDVAMGHVSKQLRSFPRYLEDLQIAVGTYFVPSLKVATGEAKLFVKEMTKTFTGDSVNDVRTVAADIAVLTSELIFGIKVTANLGQIATRVWKVSFIDPINSIITASDALFTALSNPLDEDAWFEAGVILDHVFDGFNESIKDTKKDLADIDAAVVQHALNIANAYADIGRKPDDVEGGSEGMLGDLAGNAKALGAAQSKAFESWMASMSSLEDQREQEAQSRAEALAEIESTAFAASLIGLTELERQYQLDRFELGQEYQARVIEMNGSFYLTEEEKNAALTDLHSLHLDGLTNLDDKYARTRISTWNQTFAQMSGPAKMFASGLESGMQSAVSNAIGSLTILETKSSGVFKNMATDFINLFIKAALSSLALSFVGALGGGGVLGILSKMFDTTANDAMAADQGRDFMRHFTRGTLEEADGGSEIAVGATRINTPTPSQGTSGGMLVMNVTVSGNVMTDEYMEKQVGPILQRLVNDGRSLLSVDSKHVTGDVDVNVD